MNRKLNLGLIGLLALVGFAIAVLLAAMPASAGYTGDAPPIFLGQDWNINNPTHVWDQHVYIWDADVNVNSKLTLHNASVYFLVWASYDHYDFNVAAGGSVQANDSLISAWNGAWGFYWDLYMDGTVDFERCTLSYLMNMTLDGNAKFYNRTSVYRVQYADLGGTVTFSDNAYLEHVYQELDMSGTVNVWDSSHVQYIYAEFNITGTANFEDSEIYETRDDFRITGTLNMDGSNLRYLRGGLNNTGTLMITDGYGYRIYNMILLDGPTSIDGSEFWYVYEGVHVSHDKVSVSNTLFENMYDSGFHFIDCAATLNNVTIHVYTGTARGYFTTDHVGDRDDRFPMAIGIGIWVEGGSPTFIDVDVEADATAEFNLDWTGIESDVFIYTRALATAVLIDSTDMGDVSGLTIHDSYMSVRGNFQATNPGNNPLYFYGDMEVMATGLAVVNYVDTTISDVEVYSNRLGSTYGPYMSGYYIYGYGYRSYGPRVQVVTAIVGDVTTSPDPSLTISDMNIMDGTFWFFHYYGPTYSGTGVPTYGNTILIDNVTVEMAFGTVFTFYIGTADGDQRKFDIDTRVTNSWFEGLYSQMLYYEFWPGPTDSSTATVDVTEVFSFDNNTITDSYYSWTYLYIGGQGDDMPNDNWDKTVVIADNDFVDTQGTFFYVWTHWDFVKGSDQLYMLNNNMDNTTGNNGPYYVEGFDTVRFIGNTLTDMSYGQTAEFYDYGGDDDGIKSVDWLFKDNTFDNCTNAQWSEVIFLEFGGDVVFESNEIMNMNGLISIWPEMEFTGSASLDIIDNSFHDNAAYFIEYGNPYPAFKNFVLTIEDNEVYDNDDFFLNYWGSSSTLNNFDYDATIIIEGNDVHDNMGGFIHAWGDISVTDNTFTNNAGPLLLIDYINLNIPDLNGNVYNNNVDLFMFVGKDRGYQYVAMEMAGKTLTCTGTALAFTNFEVTLEDMNIIAGTAISARNAYVNAFSSEIDGDTCEVLGDGLITTWWPVEVYVTWGDEEGNDGGTPVSGALVVFNTVSGDYYSSDYAGTDGMLAKELYPAWYVDPAGVSWLSAYNMKVAASGATNDTSVVLDMDLVGDDKVHLVLWDAFRPVVAITEPFNGAVFGKDSVETFGFVAEVGSGLDTVEYSTDGGDTWTPLTISATGDWLLTMSGLPDGQVSLKVRASDIAGNVGESTMTMTIDTTPPALSINALPEITNVPYITITGSVEVGAEVFLNGMSLGLAVDAALSIEHILHEGGNIIVVEAMDAAGNIAMETSTVLLDTHEPILVVYSPAGGIITNADSVAVTGIVEIGATLTVSGTQVVPDESGVFTYDFVLASGENTIEVKATDDATNVNMVTILVNQDQDPPDLEIREPDDGVRWDADIITVHIVADDDAVLWLNGRRLTETGDVTMNILLLEGENLITVKAMDPAGNIATEIVTVIRDTEPPSLLVTMPAVMEVWTNAASLEVEGIALKATSVKAGGQAATFDPVTGIFTATVPLSVGRNNVTVEASDGVNVVSQTITVWVDRDAPKLVVAAVEPVVKTPSVTITGETEAGIGVVTVVVGDSPKDYTVDYTGEFAVKLNLADGTYDIKVVAIDEYGNSAETTTGAFTVKAKDYLPDGEEETGPSVEPLHIGLILAVIGIALLVAAFASAHFITKRRREELEEGY